MKPQISVVLKEMFKRVGATYNEDLVQDDGWYLKYSWPKVEEDEFKEWFTDYLYNNVQARKEIMAFPRKNKVHIRKVVEEFVWNYGWKVVE